MVFVNSLFQMNRDFFGFWGYIVVFLAIFLESFPFLGAFVPGGVIALLICGFLAKLGYFALWKVVLVAVGASVLVDSFGYWLGRSRSKGFLSRRSRIFLLKRSTLEKVIRVVNGHVGKSLVIGRMNPVTRSIAPFVVGNERVAYWKFIGFSFIGSVLWVVLFVFLGYILGNSYAVIAIAERYILWTLVVLLGGFYLYYLANLFKEFFGKNSRLKNGNNC